METLDYETPGPEPYPHRASPEEEALYRWQKRVSNNTERGRVRAAAALSSIEARALAFKLPKQLTKQEAEANMRHHLSLAVIFGAAIGVGHE